MPRMDQILANDSTTGEELTNGLRILAVGHSGAGKTGSLESLVRAGYKLKIYDFDNNLASLFYQVRQKCPQLAGNVEYMQFRDSVTATQMGPQVRGTSRAYVKFAQALDTWEDGSKPSDWGPDTVMVFDSLTNAGSAAFHYAKGLNPKTKEARQWYNEAQQAIDFIISTVCGDTFKCHVIVLTHIDIIETAAGDKFFASAIGKALGPKLPRHFSTMLHYDNKFQGNTLSRFIRTNPTRELILKNPAPDKLKPEYPLEDGLASIFKALTTGV